MKDKSYICLGWFDSITQVWELHPEGGHEGEYFYVDSQKYRWNKTTRNWEYAATDPVAGGNMTVGNDLTVNNCATIGKDVRVHENVNVDRNLYVGGKIFAKGVKQPNCGFFPSEEALKAEHPTPEVGMWASVGTTMPGTVWRCETAGVWTNTGQTGGVDPTDVNYGIVNNLESESTTEALSAAMGAKLQNEKLGVVPQGLTEDQKRQAQANMGLDKVIDGLRKRTGYFVCSNFWYEPDKVVSAPNFELYPGNCIKIKMLYRNNAENPTLNINNTAPRPLFFDNKLGSKENTWHDGEVIEVYYDGECYYANSIDGGATFKTGQRVRDLGIDKVPTKGSKNLVESGGLFSALEAQDKKIDDAIKRQDDEIEDFEEAVRDHVDNYKPIVINGDVTNAPDEEDITMDENNLLKFKNRSALFGLGYVILRRGTALSEQITLQNTIYEVRYDFDLEGGELTMPDGCVLDFKGGSINNGKLVSSDTKVLGMPKGSALYGVFYNQYGEYLTHNYLSYKGIDNGLDYAWIRNGGVINEDFVMQSIAVDENYVYCLGYDKSSSSTGRITVFDRDYNYIGECGCTNSSHNNDAVVVDGVMYVTGLTLASIYYIDTQDILDAISNETDITYETQNIDIEYTPTAIDYDYANKTYCILTSAGLYILDKDFVVLEVLNRFNSQINGWFTKNGLTANWTTQGLLYKNGVVLKFMGINVGDGQRASIMIYDCATDKLVDVLYLPNQSSVYEPEGITKDIYDNDTIIYSVYGNNQTDTYYNGIGKMSLDSTVTCLEKAANGNPTDVGTGGYMRLYVDNTHTGKSLASSTNPCKTLESALLTCRNSTNIWIYLNNTSTPYKWNGRLGNRAVYELHGYTNEADDDEKPIVSGFFYLRNTNIYATYINFDNCKIRCWNGEVHLSYCKAYTPSGDLLYGDNIMFTLYDCTLEGGRIINCNYFNFRQFTGCKFIGTTAFYSGGTTAITLSAQYLLDNDFSECTKVNETRWIEFYKRCNNISEISALNSFYEDNSMLAGTLRILLVSTIPVTDEQENILYRIIAGEYIRESESWRSVGKGHGAAESYITATSDFDQARADGFMNWIGEVAFSEVSNKMGYMKQTNREGIDGVTGFVDYNGNPINTLDYGATGSRPTSLNKVGTCYFDTTLGKPIWWTGSGWVDATGTSVS